MDSFQYFMPVKIYFGKNCILEKKEVFRNFGKKAFLVTGQNSAKKNGSFHDITEALSSLDIDFVTFDQVEENPTTETIEKAARIGISEKVDFVIGIGGGSPMDAAKSIACLIANPGLTATALYEPVALKHLPLIEIPTTAGTGSETTPYSILTLHEKKTKASNKQSVFADVAFLDAKYMLHLPVSTTINTAVDALSHLIEGYLAVKSNFLSDIIAESGFKIIGECLDALKTGEFSFETREKLLLASTLGGFVIAQAGTSLPHLMGYALTYHRNIPHGQANGILTKAYLALFQEPKNQQKIKTFLNLLGFSSLDAFGDFLEQVLPEKSSFSEEEIKQFTALSVQNKTKLATFPEKISEEIIYQIYQKSLL